VWETVADYLRGSRRIPETRGTSVEIRGVEGNPGFAGQG
jgi:sulfur-oxidizing protein SoxB